MTPIKAKYNGIQDGPHPFELWTILEPMGCECHGQFSSLSINTIHAHGFEPVEEKERPTMAQTSICRGTATSVVCTTGRITVVYHNTRVVDVTPEHITLDTGGWKTVTTKRRMNQASTQFDLGYTVYQQKRQWFVSYRGITRQFDQDEIVLERV